jgi:hypothetical protein
VIVRQSRRKGGPILAMVAMIARGLAARTSSCRKTISRAIRA